MAKLTINISDDKIGRLLTAIQTGFVAILDDNSADTDVWICYTSDTSWFYLQGTKAI